MHPCAQGPYKSELKNDRYGDLKGTYLTTSWSKKKPKSEPVSKKVEVGAGRPFDFLNDERAKKVNRLLLLLR